MKKRISILFLVGVGLLLGYWLYPKTTEEKAFNDFLTTSHKESYIVLPLCSAGEKVVPLVIEKIKNKDLERRRYALTFLGTSDYYQALPVLEKTVEDESEVEIFRGDALESIYLIDESKGLRLAKNYKQTNDFLGTISKEILKKKNYAEFKKKTQNDICHPTD
jgi:hypothetical protein